MFPWGKGSWYVGLTSWQPYHLHVPIVLKSGSLNLLEPLGPVHACNGIALPFTYYILLYYLNNEFTLDSLSYFFLRGGGALSYKKNSTVFFLKNSYKWNKCHSFLTLVPNMKPGLTHKFFPTMRTVQQIFIAVETEQWWNFQKAVCVARQQYLNVLSRYWFWCCSYQLSLLSI